jgi:hypothetical protein
MWSLSGLALYKMRRLSILSYFRDGTLPAPARVTFVSGTGGKMPKNRVSSA